MAPFLKIISKCHLIALLIQNGCLVGSEMCIRDSNITFGPDLITKLWPKVSQKRSHELFNEQYNEEVFRNFIHLDANHPNILSFSYLNPFVISSKRHFGYALTWFTMAIVLISMFFYFVSTQDEE